MTNNLLERLYGPACSSIMDGEEASMKGHGKRKDLVHWSAHCILRGLHLLLPQLDDIALPVAKIDLDLACNDLQEALSCALPILRLENNAAE